MGKENSKKDFLDRSLSDWSDLIDEQIKANIEKDTDTYVIPKGYCKGTLTIEIIYEMNPESKETGMIEVRINDTMLLALLGGESGSFYHTLKSDDEFTLTLKNTGRNYIKKVIFHCACEVKPEPNNYRFFNEYAE